MSDKKHYFLIAGIVLFSFPAGEGEEPTISSVPVNAIVRHDDINFPAAKLAKAQQNLHKSFIMKMPEEVHGLLNVNDIVITNVSYLGLMTEDEFQAPPEGMAKVEVTPVPEVI